MTNTRTRLGLETCRRQAAALVGLCLLVPSCGSDDEGPVGWALPADSGVTEGGTEAGVDGSADGSTTDGGRDGMSGDSEPDTAPVGPTVILPKTSLVAEELAILVNDDDPQSVAVADAYQQKRGIPNGNVIHISIPTGAVLSEADFGTAKAEVDAAAGPNIQAFVITWTTPYRVECMSAVSAFALGFDRKYCNTTGGSCGQTAPVDYFDSNSFAPFTDHGIRPTMMLAAADTPNALDLIDRGVVADDTFPTGDGYFVRTTDNARSVRWSNFIETVDDWDYPEGLSLSYTDASDGSLSETINNATDVLFYFTGLANVPGIDTNTYRPGAVADHLTSTGGRVPDGGQMSVVAWLEAGVTASYGTVVEPCNYQQKFPNTRVMLPHYFRGETVLEAYWKSVLWPGEGNFVGEPLARPWGSSQVTFDNGTLSIRTTLLNPEKTYELQEGDAESGPFSAVLTDITVARHERTTITYSPATSTYYRLVESAGP